VQMHWFCKASSGTQLSRPEAAKQGALSSWLHWASFEARNTLHSL